MFYRNPVECVAQLLDNPSFKDEIGYAAVKTFEPSGNRVYHEMYSGDLWNEAQVSDDELEGVLK